MPRLQFRLSTLLWLTFAVAFCFAGIRLLPAQAKLGMEYVLAGIFVAGAFTAISLVAIAVTILALGGTTVLISRVRFRPRSLFILMAAIAVACVVATHADRRQREGVSYPPGPPKVKPASAAAAFRGRRQATRRLTLATESSKSESSLSTSAPGIEINEFH
jgi:hypothetical protein